jgi:hypothetical protein
LHGIKPCNASTSGVSFDTDIPQCPSWTRWNASLRRNRVGAIRSGPPGKQSTRSRPANFGNPGPGFAHWALACNIEEGATMPSHNFSIRLSSLSEARAQVRDLPSGTSRAAFFIPGLPPLGMNP